MFRRHTVLFSSAPGVNKTSRQVEVELLLASLGGVIPHRVKLVRRSLDVGCILRVCFSHPALFAMGEIREAPMQVLFGTPQDGLPQFLPRG